MEYQPFVEERGMATDDLPGSLRLALERLDIAHGVEAALNGLVARIDGWPPDAVRGCS